VQAALERVRAGGTRQLALKKHAAPVHEAGELRAEDMSRAQLENTLAGLKMRLRLLCCDTCFACCAAIHVALPPRLSASAWP